VTRTQDKELLFSRRSRSGLLSRRKVAGGLDHLPRVAWEGGPAYWSQFPKTDAAGWDADTFFPIAVFLMKPDSGHPAALADIGINVAMAIEGQSPGVSTTAMAAAGIWGLASPDNPYEHDGSLNQITDPGWDFSEIGSNAQIVGWFLADEPDMGYGGWPGNGNTNNNQNGYLDALEGLSATADGHADGRIKWSNFGNGVLNTFWSPDTLDEMIDLIHGFSVDKYPYTSPGVRFEYGRSADWAAACNQTQGSAAAENAAKTASAYGWMVKQMVARFQDPAALKPHWGFIEVKMPKLNETGSSIITHAEMKGGLWSQIICEARGIAYFQHNGDANWPATDPNTGATPTTETYTLVDGPTTYKTAVDTINSEITALAPVINTQSYVWDFGATRMYTMLKAKDGFAYIFACIGPGGTTGSKTFTLPSGINGTTAEVVYESRNVSVVSGQITDTFANEYTHHIYKIAL
jgi:hypothetical protein